MAENPNDIEQKIKLTYETNAEQTAGEVNDLNKSMENTNTVMEKTTKETKKLSTNQKGASNSAKEQSEAFSTLSPALSSVANGIKTVTKAMWALVANPIIAVLAAIVLGLTLLFKAFTSTNDGADKMEQVMAGISATIDVLRDRVLKVGEAIAKFFSGDFKGALETARTAVSGIGDEIAAEFNKAADAAKRLQEVEDATRELGVARAKLNRDLAESKDLIADENAGYKEKKEALEKVKKIEGEQTAQELANAKKKLKAIQDLNALSDTSDEDLQKEADARIALYNLEEKSAQDRKAIKREEKKIENEERARRKAIADEQKRLHKEELDRLKALAKAKADLLKEGYDKEAALLKSIQDLNDKTEEEKLARQKERDLAEIEALKQKGIDVSNILVLNAEKYDTLEQELRDKRQKEQDERDLKAKEEREKKAQEELDVMRAFADKQVEIDKAKADQKKAIQDAEFKAADSAVSFLKQIAGKSKAAQKGAIIAENAIGVAKMIIANNTANIAALATPQAIATSGAAAAPVIAMNNISTALGVASTIAATAKALQAVGGGSAGSAPSVGGSGSSGASATPNVSFQASSENQIANTIATNTNEQPPVKAYVVSKDMTTAQNIDNNKIEANSVGG